MDGSASSDRDGSIEYYQWTQTKGPLAVLNEVDQHVAPQKAMFTALNVGPNGDTMVFTLTIFDTDWGNFRNTVNVKVNGGAQQQNATLFVITGRQRQLLMLNKTRQTKSQLLMLVPTRQLMKAML